MDRIANLRLAELGGSDHRCTRWICRSAWPSTGSSARLGKPRTRSPRAPPASPIPPWPPRVRPGLRPGTSTGLLLAGLRSALGAGVPADGGFARTLLRRAADGGCAEALDAAEVLVPKSDTAKCGAWASAAEGQPRGRAAGICGAGPIPGREHAQSCGRGAGEPPGRHRASLAAHRRQRAAGVPAGGSSASLHARPEAWKWLAQAPRVGVSQGFATREECAHLVNKMGQSLKRASDYRRSSSANDDVKCCTSTDWPAGRGDAGRLGGAGAGAAIAEAAGVKHRIARAVFGHPIPAWRRVPAPRRLFLCAADRA